MNKNSINFSKLINDGYLTDQSYHTLVNNDFTPTFECDDFSASRLISIIIPTHNRLKQLLTTIASISMQTYSNYEIIIVDDNSTDSTFEYFSSHSYDKVYYYRNNYGMGASKSRKEGFEKARGQIVIFCDDDDYYIDINYFKSIAQIIENSPNTSVLCANSVVHYIQEDKYDFSSLDFPEKFTNKDYFNSFGLKYKKPNSSFTLAINMDIIKRDEFLKLNVFNDTSLYLYALLTPGNIGYIKPCVGVYNIHNSNMTGRVSADFVIENLTSKYMIYQASREIGLINNKNWLYDQSNITINYFLQGKHNAIGDDLKIMKWILLYVNSVKKLYLLLKMSKYTFKDLIKLKQNEKLSDT